MLFREVWPKDLQLKGTLLVPTMILKVQMLTGGRPKEGQRRSCNQDYLSEPKLEGSLRSPRSKERMLGDQTVIKVVQAHEQEPLLMEAQQLSRRVTSKHSEAITRK
jgi:hypothetical protein